MKTSSQNTLWYTLQIAGSLSLIYALTSVSRSIGFIIGSIAIVDYAGNNSMWTGLPSLIVATGSAISSYSSHYLLEKFGYKWLIAAMCAVGGIGSMLMAFSTETKSTTLLLLGFFLGGIAFGVIALGRYAAAEVAKPSIKARAIGIVIFGGTVGAVLGPFLLHYIPDISIYFSFVEYKTPWFLCTAIFGLTMLVSLIGLNPEPNSKAIGSSPAKSIGTSRDKSDDGGDEKIEINDISLNTMDIENISTSEISESKISVSNSSVSKASESNNSAKTSLFKHGNPVLYFAMATMTFSQTTMILIMTIIPVYMHSLGYSVADISYVISAHFAGMFGFSFFIGWLIDRFGSYKIIAIGCILLVIGAILSGIYTDIFWLSWALFGVGFGWNFCFIGGSHIFSAEVKLTDAKRFQAYNESFLFAASGLASLAVGFVYASLGLHFLVFVSCVVAVLPLLGLFLIREKQAIKG